MAEDQKEEESDEFNQDILDIPHNDAAARTIHEEQDLKIEKTQLDQSFLNAEQWLYALSKNVTEVGQDSTKRQLINLVFSKFEITMYFVYF